MNYAMRSVFVALALTVVAALSHGGGGATQPKPTGFKGFADLVEVVQSVQGFSDDKQAVTVLFRNLQADVGGPGRPLVATRTVTVALPFDKKEEVPLTQDVRGFVSVLGKARPVLVVQAAGKTTVVDLHKAQQAAKEKAPAKGSAAQQASDRAKAAAKEFPPNDKQPATFDFMHRIDGKVTAGGGYQVTFFLLVERDAAAADNGALLVVDALDVELRKGDGGKQPY